MKDLSTQAVNSPNILIVDDVPANLMVLNDILEGNGYKVRPVPNGHLAIQVALKELPDLVLLDIMMPDINGFEVCRRFKENKLLSEIPIIFISALNDTNDIIKAFNSGGVDYISKPFRAEEVSARVSTHLKLHRQNKELYDLNASKDKFFSIIAHDLRGPFNGFLGLTQIMVEELQTLTMEEIREIAFGMKSSATNLYRLLENLLKWAMVQQGLITLIPEQLELLTVTNESIEMIREAAKGKNIDIEFDIPDSLTVMADKNILQTVVRNLVSNAIKFTDKGGRILISVEATNEWYIQISVTDSGIGISPEMVKDLFRIDVRTGRKGTGGEQSTGLGLLLCKELVEKQGGTIWAESEVGKGSKFCFTIPSAP